ncbi:response regulator transcription factor [Rossellomorea sp. DUT-2]|uniref:response regulator transcription factor n=1 Tax=Rossellomorea sp. DUT-2 TaxID=3412021 RepID=UPI002D7860EA|nr:response regulator transcription factor [Rossellomorea aquimaris]WRP07382.1 response regulator transcription factor [Rossellomorea aquimaris]
MNRVLIINDNELLGRGIKQVLEESDFKVTFIKELQNKAGILPPLSSFDIYIIDLESPDISVNDLTRGIFQTNTEAKVICLYERHIAQIYQYAELGISGLIKKTTPTEDLISTLKLVLNGQALFPLSLIKQLADSQQLDRMAKNSMAHALLSPKELEILNFVAAGKKNRQIAEQLYMSIRSVEYYLTKSFKKLGVSSRMEAYSKAMELGLIDINKTMHQNLSKRNLISD